MDVLKQRLAAIGLSEDQVNNAVATVADFVKEQLPEDYRGMVDDLLAGKTPDLSSLSGGLMEKMRSLFS